MPLDKVFSITQRHYDLLIQQSQKCYPEETGGILGGRGTQILSIFPIINKQVESRNSQFGLNGEDLERGHIFLKKHSLEYLGIYHTHPKGIAYPSDADLSHNQKYLFIISLADNTQPDFRAYEVQGKTPYPVPIQIVSNKGIEVVDVFSGKVSVATDPLQSERDQLNDMINAMLNQQLKYPKQPPKNPFEKSSFHTTA
jgi:proteasome lid subunit RPN8/RPN11